MRRVKRTLAIVTLATLVRCSSPALPASTPTTATITLRLYATTATAALVSDLVSTYSQLNPGFVFETQLGNNERMVERLLNRETPYFLTNHLPTDSPLWAAPIGQDGIVIITHIDNQVTHLTTEQVRALYQGHVTNWNEVGGADLPVVVISRENGSGTRAEFEGLVMGTRRTTQAALVVPSSQAMITRVAQTVGSVGYASISAVDPTVRAVVIDGAAPTLENIASNAYPLRATLFIVGLGEPETDYRAFVGWVQSPVGQGVVARHYAPLLYAPP